PFRRNSFDGDHAAVRFQRLPFRENCHAQRTCQQRCRANVRDDRCRPSFGRQPSTGSASGETWVTSFRAWLETLADAGALVPATTVLARLSEFGDVEPETSATTSDQLSDLTVEAVASALHRSPSTIRGLLGN